MTNGEAGKGDRYRPLDKKRFDRNWDRIFGKKGGNLFTPICDCDHRLGENCPECYTNKGTKPCLSRWCGECNIKECKIRTWKYEPN